MWIKQILYCLLAVAHLYFLTVVQSQEEDPSHTPQNLTCITHNLQSVICTWTTASATNSGITYQFCHSSSTTTPSPNCSSTEDKRANLSLVSFTTVDIEIITLKSGNSVAANRFVLSESNITLVPQTPHILSLVPNSSTRTFTLSWNDGGSVFLYELDASWEIQILRKEAKEQVALETYHSKLTGDDTVLHWNWTLDIPFECTTHYVRIRCYLHERAFSGRKKWSEWSQFALIPGNDNGSFFRVYPEDPVLLAGSTVAFCCVWKTKQHMKELQFDNCRPERCPSVNLSNQSRLIYVQNININENGKNAYCMVLSPGQKYEGSVPSVGYPPDVPKKVSCETWNLKEITCKWEPGRSTGLSGNHETRYSLFERISGGNVTGDGIKEEHNIYYCMFRVRDNQTTYNFTVHASNILGQNEASVSTDIYQRVHPQSPSQLTVNNNSPTNISLSWYLPGNFVQIRLHCQISEDSTRKELQNVLLDGAEDSHYRTSIDKLHPYTEYTFEVRCSAAPPLFWKWSNWSEKIRHRTLQAPPARAPDVWRERSADGETVNIFWKPLPVSEKNGVIQNHKVSWFLPEMSEKVQLVPEPYNSTEIKLGKNDCIFTVVVENQAGPSPPSQINSAEIPNFEAKTEKGIAKGDGIHLAWHPDANVSCGYTVKWCHPPGSGPCIVNWEAFPSNATNAVIKSALFQPGIRYHFSVYGCKTNGYQLLKYVHGYTEELEPTEAPVFEVERSTSDSILIKWKDIPVEHLRGFLKGYLLRFAKEEEGATKPKASDLGHTRTFNITDPEQKTLTISGLQGKTRYYLNFSSYTAGGIGPAKEFYVITEENPVGLIIAIIIPVVIVVVLGVVTSILCYRKREWIKETFYPDIPNPENCKALEFPKVPKGSPNSKTLEMNPCTPNNIEVVETQSPGLKIADTAMTSPVAEDLPEDGLDSETEGHVVVSYCPPIIEEEISNPPVDESSGSSQVIYIDIQSLKEEPEVDCVAAAGYKPQMQLPVNSVRDMGGDATSSEEEKGAGYRPQVNATSWNTGCPDSPTSVGSNNENASFGSPCSINSRQFLIPSKEDDNSPKAINTGWSFASFFHNKPSD